MIPRLTTVRENARSALECGGWTPPCSFQIHTHQRAKPGRSASQEPRMKLGRKAASSPSTDGHSTVPSAQRFSEQCEIPRPAACLRERFGRQAQSLRAYAHRRASARRRATGRRLQLLGMTREHELSHRPIGEGLRHLPHTPSSSASRPRAGSADRPALRDPRPFHGKGYPVLSNRRAADRRPGGLRYGWQSALLASGSLTQPYRPPCSVDSPLIDWYI
jgi:hypothetical protein